MLRKGGCLPHPEIPDRVNTWCQQSSETNYIAVSNIRRYRVGESKHNTLLRCRCHRVDDMFRPFTIRPWSDLTWWKLKRKITMLHIVYIHSMLWLRGGGHCNGKVSSLGLRIFGWGPDWREQSLSGSSPLCVITIYCNHTQRGWTT